MDSLDLYFTDLFENTSDLIQYVSLDGIIEKVNPAWLGTLGYQYDEVRGKSIDEFVAGQELSAYKTYRHTILKNGLNDNIQVTFLAKTGSPIILQGHLRPFFIDGILKHTRGVFRNITTKIQEEKLQQAQLARITEFLTYAPVAVVIIDEYQNVIEWNLKASEIFGYSSFEAQNQTLAEMIIPIQYREAHYDGMSRFLRTGQGSVLNKTIEVLAIDKSLREFPISLSISAVMFHMKWFFIAFINDISDRKQKE